MKCCLLLLVVVATAFGIPSGIGESEWAAFKHKHGKNYNATEEQHRQRKFAFNLDLIDKHNKRHAQGLESFKLAVNEFSDMDLVEFVRTMNGYKRVAESNQIARTKRATVPTTTSVTSIDWRLKGAVTPVKNQGRCGSCYSFSATGALEAQYFNKTGKLVSLSEQNIIDCSGQYGNGGCNGGNMDNSFYYIKVNNGINTAVSYPYTAVRGTCRFNAAFIGATDRGYVNLPSGSEAALQAAIANVGPVSIAIDASHASFQNYKSGIYYEPLCSSTNLDHAVLAVGFGTENGTDYWLVKNSWGTTWGEQGYIRIARNRNNHCGVATVASYPLV